MRRPEARIPATPFLAALSIAVCLPNAVRAGTLYDFAWSGNSFSATGTLELDDAVGVGDPFETDDLLAFEVELFDGAVSVASLEFPPFVAFHTVVGTRNASTLSIDDLAVSGFAILFGCDAVDCFSGRVYFDTSATPGALVDFGSIEAARASFVFTEAPEPGATASAGIALAALAGLRAVGSLLSGGGIDERSGNLRGGYPPCT